jgi:hypothetical protein
MSPGAPLARNLTGARTGSNQGTSARDDSALVERVYQSVRSKGGYVRRRDLWRILTDARADRRAELAAGAWLQLHGFDPTPSNAAALAEILGGEL